MDQLDVFRRNFLVVGLPDSVISEVAAIGEQITLTAGDVLIRKGDKSGDLYVLLEGKVDVYSEAGDRLATAEAGSVIGEVALVDDQPRSADVVCVGLTRVLRLPAKELRAFMASNKDAGFVMLANLTRVLSMRLRNSAVKMEELKAKAAEDPWKYAL